MDSFVCSGTGREPSEGGVITPPLSRDGTKIKTKSHTLIDSLLQSRFTKPPSCPNIASVSVYRK